MVTAIAWRQMVAHFPNLKGINGQHQQTIQIKQSLSAPRLRFWLANDYGDQPLPVQDMTVTNADSETMSVTVNHQSSFQVPARGRCWSDWLPLPIQAGTWLTITLVSPEVNPQTLAQSFDQTLIRVIGRNQPYFYGPVAIEIERAEPVKSLLFFGDSLTNQGYYSAAFSQKLMTAAPDQWGLTNGGISGNRLLRPGNSTSVWSPSFGLAGLNRLPTLLSEQSVDWLIFMEGLNDLLHPGNGSPQTELPTAAALIAGIKQVQTLAAMRSLRLTLATITPFKTGVIGEKPAWTPAKEQIRQVVNTYLRSLPNTVDFDRLVATADQRLAAAFDCGDHIHFSAAGSELVAQFLAAQLAID